MCAERQLHPPINDGYVPGCPVDGVDCYRARRSADLIQSAIQALGKDLRDLLRLLDEHGVRFLVVGGFAVAVHGIPRYTKELDLWVECSEDNARRLVGVLDAFGFGSLGLQVEDFATPDLVIQLGYEPNRIDFLTGLTGVSFEEAYPKRITSSIDGIDVPVIDRDSLAANKRAFGRPQDLADVEGLEK